MSWLVTRMASPLTRRTTSGLAEPIRVATAKCLRQMEVVLSAADWLIGERHRQARLRFSAVEFHEFPHKNQIGIKNNT
jgi:hypothetical protein